MKRTSFISYLIIIAFFIFPTLTLAGSAIVTWTANTDSDLAGYRIYYSTSKGGPYGSSTDLIPKPQISHTITDLTDGETYYFVVVAVDTAGNESPPSTPEVSKLIVTAAPPTAVSLSADVSSPQAVGTTVTITATGSGGSGNYEYQFWRHRPDGGWEV
ncbi:MAG: fibronectin type III domain-containing protein, partial [Deltaproteobacteria bacterium]|nr:fibronectin type III domain-containing protein [Deltaproteobacteria bacterium]